MQHTYCIHAHLHMLHMYAARVLHTQYIHIACLRIHKNLVQRHTYAIQAYEEMYAVCVHAACMLYINNCMYAAHNNCTHIAYMCATSCACMWHACGVEPIFVYAAHMQYCVCSTHAVYMHSMCSKEADICAAHKQPFCKG